MLAVVEISKKQYLVKKGDFLEVEKLKETKGEVTFDKVLLLAKDKAVNLGTPYLDKVKVKAQIIRQKKGKKIIVYKYRRRKKYRKKAGHRQTHTSLKISEIIIPPARRTAKK